jgi:hypothetical protein
VIDWGLGQGSLEFQDFSSMNKGEFYYRSGGVECYALPLFFHPDGTRGLSDTFRELLLCEQIEWCWRSSVRSENISGDTSLFIPLSASNIPQFIEDLIFVDEWDLGKNIELIGYDCGKSSLVIDEYNLRFYQALTHFAVYEGGPIRIAVITLDDTDNSLVFVPHKPIPLIEKFLASWDAPWLKSNAQRKYHKLGVATLESMYAINQPW